MRNRASLWAAIAALAILHACGPTELATPTPQQIEDIVRTSFPSVLVDVVAVERADSTLRAPARFGGFDGILVLEADGGEWTVVSLEMEEITYAVEDLQAIRDTMLLMEEVSNALEAYATEHGQVPTMDDLVGLEELVPDFHDADRGFEDGWGNPLHYGIQGDDYVLTSGGPDGEVGTPDDIIIVRG